MNASASRLWSLRAWAPGGRRLGPCFGKRPIPEASDYRMRVARSTKRVGFEGARPNNRMKLTGGEGCSHGRYASALRGLAASRVAARSLCVCWATRSMCGSRVDLQLIGANAVTIKVIVELQA